MNDEPERDVAPGAERRAETSVPATHAPTAAVAGSADAGSADAGSPVAGSLPASLASVPISRRQLLQLGAVSLPCLAGSTALYGWLTGLAAQPTTPVDPIVASYDPTAHQWAFVVDTRACIGCGQCVVACKQENGVPFDHEHTRTWVERHSVAEDGTVVTDAPDAGIHGFPADAVPAGADREAIRTTQFVPRLCMQCENSPCTSVCPVGATFRTADGVILVDEQRCIGCGYCVVACPYGARYLVPAGAQTPTGVAGVADKCTFCYHRITRGQDPACVEICPVGARKCGDLNEVDGEVSTILREQPTRVIKPALGTRPRVHYLGLEGEDA